MTNALKKEIKSLIDKYQLDCSIDDFKNSKNINWLDVSIFNKLSEDFIEKYKDKISWGYISAYQKLSENFIEKYKDKVDWSQISEYQKLSEDFIKKFKDKVDWYHISKFQKLSENFIVKYKDYVYWSLISQYQKLSSFFIKKYKLNVPENNTLYMTKKEISDLIPSCYERKGDYIIAYKNIRTDRYSHFNFQYRYEKGRIYESHCDCNNKDKISFGLSLWTKEKAKDFNDNGIVVKCRVKIEDIGAVVHKGNKLRCKRIEVLE